MRGSILGLVPLIIFINDFEDEIEFTVSKIADDIKLGGVVDILKGRLRIKVTLIYW